MFLLARGEIGIGAGTGCAVEVVALAAVVIAFVAIVLTFHQLVLNLGFNVIELEKLVRLQDGGKFIHILDTYFLRLVLGLQALFHDICGF